MNETEEIVKIGSLLRRAKWRLPGDASPNVRMEQHTGDGMADYTLQDSRSCLLEIQQQIGTGIIGEEKAIAA